MEEIGVNGMTVPNVLGCGMQKGAPEYYRGVKVEMTLLPKIQVDIVVTKVPAGDCYGQAGSVYRPHRRWQDLRLPCGKCGEG